jgi:hypothetical protein
MCRRGTRACYHLDFQSKNFSYAIFIVKRRPLYVNFSLPLGGKYLFCHPSTTLVNMGFCTHVPNSSKNKNMKSCNPYLRPKMVFLASKTLLSLLGTVEKTFSLTLNIMIWQTIKATYLRFCEHLQIQVRYKILWLEVLKESSILDTSPCFQQGLI